MKYIRTKDGIYEVVKEEILFGVKFYDYETREGFVNRIREEQIIKVADTPEELCDEFVIDNPNDWNSIKKPFIYENNRAGLFEEHSIKFCKDNNITRYGAIWTEKGLIYVAKMNENGDLELI